MKAKTVSSLICFLIFCLLSFFFFHDLFKLYYSSELAVLNMSMKEILRNSSSGQKQLLLMNALPMLNKAKNRFLRHPGYWPYIFNGYNQAAFVEYLNGDKKAAVRLLLRSLHYHPNLHETFKALSIYLKEVGEIKASKACRKYSVALLKGLGISPEDRQTCIKEAIAFSSNQ